MAADYHTETPHILDFSKYPGAWLAEGFCFFFKHLSLLLFPLIEREFFLPPPGLEDRQRFVRIYLSSSGNKTFILHFICTSNFSCVSLFSFSFFLL